MGLIERGGEEYAKLGTPNNTGTRILCVSGAVPEPGYFEVEVGKVTMGELIDMCGGLKEGRSVKAVIPGGSSAKVLRGDETFMIKKDGKDVEIGIMDIPMDFDTLAACGSMAGSGGARRELRERASAYSRVNTSVACAPCRTRSRSSGR